MKFQTVISNQQGAEPILENHVIVRERRGIFALADGFGGGRVGLQAAKTATEALVEFMEREAGDHESTLPFELRSYLSLAGNVLLNGFLFANQKVTALNSGKNVHECGGSSAVAGYLDGSLLAVGGVGSGAAWLIRSGRCARLIEARTYEKFLNPLGREEVRGIPLTSLGTAPDLQPELAETWLAAGDWLVLATHGLGEEDLQALQAAQQRGVEAPELLSHLNQRKRIFNSSISLSIFSN